MPKTIFDHTLTFTSLAPKNMARTFLKIIVGSSGVERLFKHEQDWENTGSETH